MSGSIEKLIEALDRNTVALESMMAQAKGETTKPTTTEVAAKPAAKKALAKRTAKVKPMPDQYNDFLSEVTGDELKARKAAVKSVVDYFGIRLSELPDKDHEEALRYLAQLKNNEYPSFDDDDEDDSLV